MAPLVSCSALVLWLILCWQLIKEAALDVTLTCVNHAQ